MNGHWMGVRFFVVLTFLVGCFGICSWRLIFLQLTLHEEASAVVERQHRSEESLPARRGSILDHSGALLASDKPVRHVVVDLYHLNHLDHAREAIAKLEGRTAKEVSETYEHTELRRLYINYVSNVLSVPLGIAPREIFDRLTSKSRGEIVLVRELEEDVGAQLALDLGEQSVIGVECRKGMIRHYASDRLGHVVGFVDHERKGLVGVEKALEEELAGHDGRREVVRDGSGNEILALRGKVVEPRHGNSITLTYDMRIQEITEQAVDQAFLQHSPVKAMAVVVRPATGEVLAMANRPHFDRETMRGNLRNYAVEALYEPGSTVKPITAGGALDLGLVSISTLLDCRNLGNLPGNLSDDHPMGHLSVSGVIAHSSNIGIYRISQQLGRRGLYDYMRRFGFGERTGIELSGELRGVLRKPEKWSSTSLSRVGIGYEISVTPLQMAMAMSAVANGGELLKPSVVAAIHDQEGRLLHQFQKQVVRQAISPRTSSLLRHALSQATSEGGTGTQAQVTNWSVAGKTGTAKRYDEKLGKYVDDTWVVSFAGFAPQENPELVVVVVVDKPAGTSKIYGGTVAAPVFSQIVGPSLDYLSVQGSLSSVP